MRGGRARGRVFWAVPRAALRVAAAAALHPDPLDGADILGRVVARPPLQRAGPAHRTILNFNIIYI